MAVDGILRAVERSHTRGHGKTGGRGDSLRLIGARQLDDRGRASQPRQTPACHGISFAKAIDDDGAFGHAWFGGNAVMYRAVVENMLVDFVAHHIEVMFDGDLCQVRRSRRG